MRVDVLGPIAVAVGGHQVSIGGQRQRALMAALVVDHGKVVPVDRLVDVLWPSDPPATAPIKVRAHVSAIRQAIGLHADATKYVITRAPGYMLTQLGVETDISRFSGMFAAARVAAEAGDRDWASDALGDALGLWRGPAFADVTSSVIKAAAAILEERRLLAIETKADVDLTLGKADLVASETRAALVLHPFRERLRGLVMVALYQLGCRADALALYREGYEQMRSELGIGPGPQLHNLHQRILSDDRSLSVAGWPGGRVASWPAGRMRSDSPTCPSLAARARAASPASRSGRSLR